MGVMPGVPPPGYFPAYQPALPTVPPQPMGMPPGAPLPAAAFVPTVIPPAAAQPFQPAPFNPGTNIRYLFIFRQLSVISQIDIAIL